MPSPDLQDLRRLAEAENPTAKEVAAYYRAVDPDTLLALIDAAERADRLAALVEQARLMEWMQEYAPEWCAEVDRA